MFEIQRLGADLKRLRQSRFKSSRAFAAASNISREIARKIESGERAPDFAEFVAWVSACKADPLQWLIQYLTEDQRRIAEADKDMLLTFRQAMKIPERRRAIEALFDSWKTDDALADINDRRESARRGGRLEARGE